MKRCAMHEVAVIMGTGPGLTQAVSQATMHLQRFGVNNTLQLGVDVHLACNVEWWDHYGAEARAHPGEKWIAIDDEHPERAACAERWGLRTVRGVWAPGLSTDPAVIHYHHGAGPQMVNLALHYGIRVMLLVGWDMRYGAQRHYFGEYPTPLQHWPRTGPNGELEGLIREMESIRPADYGIEIVNCTPDSALTCFPMMPLAEALSTYAARVAC